MSYSLGLSLGSSAVAASIVRDAPDGGAANDSAPRQSQSVSSLVHIAADGTFLVGAAAERARVDDPCGAVDDYLRRVGDDVPIIVNGLAVQPEDLVASVIRWVTDQIESAEGEPPAAVAVAHPAGWGDYRRAVVTGALARVGLDGATLLSTPLAIARWYAARYGSKSGVIAILDLGRSGSECAVVAVEESPAITARATSPRGGADLDDLLIRHLRPETIHGIDDDVEHARLFREGCVDAKHMLSDDFDAVVAGPSGRLRIVRAELEELAVPLVHEASELLGTTVSESGLEIGDLRAVVLAGGTARIPVIAESLTAESAVETITAERPWVLAAEGSAHAAFAVMRSAPAPAAAPVAVLVPAPQPAQSEAAEEKIEPAAFTLLSFRRAARVGAALAVAAAAATGIGFVVTTVPTSELTEVENVASGRGTDLETLAVAKPQQKTSLPEGKTPDPGSMLVPDPPVGIQADPVSEATVKSSRKPVSGTSAEPSRATGGSATSDVLASDEAAEQPTAPQPAPQTSTPPAPGPAAPGPSAPAPSIPEPATPDPAPSTPEPEPTIPPAEPPVSEPEPPATTPDVPPVVDSPAPSDTPGDPAETI